MDRRRLLALAAPLAAILSSVGQPALAASPGGAADLAIEPGFLSIVPALLAIAVAILARQVVPALVIGVMGGVLIAQDMDVGLALRSSIAIVVEAVSDRDHARIIVFSLLMGGMVGVISRSGGTHGIVELLSRFSRTPRSGQAATASLGVAIFFDDYANCLIVGNTMRPVTDRLRISREKLAYLVDSTAAPVASLVPLSTWAGFQVGQVAGALENAVGYSAQQAFPLVLASIAYMFYPMFALLLVFLVAFSGRDLFTMHGAELRARSTGKLLRDGAQPLAADTEEIPIEGAPGRAVNALGPLAIVVALTLFGLWRTGTDAATPVGDGLFANVRAVVGAADAYEALLWASFGGAGLAVLLAWGQRILSLEESVEALTSGMKALLLAMMILVLSWSLGAITTDLKADVFLVELLGDAMPPSWLPLLVFALAGVTAFATGSAWGTMGILTPLVVPMAASLGAAPAFELAPDQAQVVMLASIASVLGGSVFGDHCSPISDTTVLSSMATSCDHIDHVRTQVPYALLTAGVAIAAGYVPVALGVAWWVAIPVGAALMIGIVRVLGKTVGA